MNLNEISVTELLEIYEKVDTFIKFLDKEYKDASAEIEK